MTIKVLEKTEGCLPIIFHIGDWIDLRTAEDVRLSGPYAKTLHTRKKANELDRIRDVMFDSTLIKLGICIQLPKGYEAIVVPRSSTFKKLGIMQTNSIGVIDGSYCSDRDEWRMPVIALRSCYIPKGTRIAQFRIQLSQKATIWQKIRWMFSRKVKIKRVLSLDNAERGGFGSTGSN